MPAWLNKAGEPKSWRHYVVGMRHLDKNRARTSLDRFRATAVAWGGGDNRDAWIEEMENLAGY